MRKRADTCDSRTHLKAKSNEEERTIRSAVRVYRRNWHKDLKNMKSHNPADYWRRVKGRSHVEYPMVVLYYRTLNMGSAFELATQRFREPLSALKQQPK
ncbi:hypothetical protein BaRGS_00036414 [Batillaria attramentaria]|uniref:Uncharacterized protein n=1 Tax=Batillaria attramentaria TaxID=370345 RepID=A0ABD0JCE1_9CAEN